VPVILDTDIGPDCDDVSAVTLLHALADRGEAKILATMCCTSSEWGGPCLDALNTYFGHPDVSVGTLKDAGLLDYASFNRVLAERYPHRLKSGKDAPDATALYREVLARQADDSVAVVAVGPLRNLDKLLASGPDRYSPLGGRELVARKVRLLACMGGWYPKAPEGSGPEYNFAQDGRAARRVTGNWPTPIVFSGAEVGSGIMTGRRIATDAPEYHPLTLAYAAFPDAGFGQDRPSWDDTVVLAAVRGARGYWKLSAGGLNRVDDKGGNAFAEGRDRGHRFLIPRMPVSELEDVLEDLTGSAREGPLAFDWNIAAYCQDGVGTVTAQDETAPDGRALHAVDRDASSVWSAKAPASWVQYQCPDGKKYVVSRYRITSGRGGEANDPRDWMLSGSNDGGATWTELDRRAGESFAGRGRTQEFAFANATAYNAYRLRLTAAARLQVAGVELLERVDNAARVRVGGVALDRPALSVPAAGRAALHVSVRPGNALDKHVAWSSSDPAVAAVKAVGKENAVVAGLRPGTCTVTATTRDGRMAASCAVTVTRSTLPTPWAYEEVNAPAVPGAALYRDGVFTVTGGGRAIERWWQRVHDQFAFVSRGLDGDGAVEARVVGQSAPSPHAIAGVMFRESADRDSRFVMLAVSPSREVFLSWRDGPEDEGPRAVLGKFDLPVRLKLVRRGAAFEAFAANDGGDWGRPLGSHAGKAFARRVKAGLCVTGHNNPTTSTAAFDHVACGPGG
jgi:hypothetical protein